MTQMRTNLMALTAAVLTSAANAQPASFTDLGDRSATQTFTQLVTLASAADIQWFRLQLPAISASAGWFDVWTTPTVAPLGGTDLTDTEIGLYNSTGARAVNTAAFADDNDGPGAYSQLTFGSTASPRPAVTFSGQTNGNARGGADGVLAAGVYYLAVGSSDVTFANAGFGVTSAYTGPRRTTLLSFDIHNPNVSTPPSAVGVPSIDPAEFTDTVRFTVTVTPGANPTSSGITVTANLTSIGGPAVAVFHDDGLDGDLTAGNNVFSYLFTVPPNAVDTTYTLTANVADAQGRTASATITGDITGPVTWDEMSMGGADAGQTLATAQTPAAANSEVRVITGVFGVDDVDIYKVSVCDPQAFMATTRFSNPLLDTQLFLFKDNGRGVIMNDEVPVGLPGANSHASTLTGELIPASGNYFLAISRWDVDPMTASGTIWSDDPPNTVRAPDGTDPTGALASWTGSGASGVYRISLTGVCVPVLGCGPADLGRAGGQTGADGHLDNNDFIVFIDFFFVHSGAADVGSIGGAHGGDGVWDNNDFIVYIDLFFAGPSECH
jgi:hypothetical protein